MRLYLKFFYPSSAQGAIGKGFPRTGSKSSHGASEIFGPSSSVSKGRGPIITVVESAQGSLGAIY